MTIRKMTVGVMPLCLKTVSANAGLFSITVNGAFSDDIHGPDDVSAITNGGAGFKWGIPATCFKISNRFTFTGFGFSNQMENTACAIGDFDCQNGSVYNSTGINGVKSAIKMVLTVPVTKDAIFDYNFTITNTHTTTGNPVINVASTASPESFACPGNDYSLNLPGFSSDGGTTIRTDFSCPEGSCQFARLFSGIATVEPANVSEPASSVCSYPGFHH